MTPDPRNIGDVTVVIPTIRDHIVTRETVPEKAEVIVRRDEGLNVARNAGVEVANNDWIVIVDDDVDFPSDMVLKQLQRMDRRTLAGLADFPPLRWVIGRMMLFHHNLWTAVGGFDEARHHGGDTDFAIRVEKAGGDVVRLDREAVPHYDDETGDSMSKLEHLEWIMYLSRRHPRAFGPVALKHLPMMVRGSFR